MAGSVNKVILIGNVGAEPEIRTTSNGKRVAKISLATSGYSDRTDWHRVSVFYDKLVDVVEQYVHKGDRLYVEGRIEYSSSEGRDGVTKYFTDIIAREITLLGGGGRNPAESSEPAEQAEEAMKPALEKPVFAAEAPSLPF